MCTFFELGTPRSAFRLALPPTLALQHPLVIVISLSNDGQCRRRSVHDKRNGNIRFVQRTSGCSLQGFNHGELV
jgi:hypothetical protein